MADSIVINLAERYAAAFGAEAVSNLLHRQAVIERDDNRYKVQLYPKYDVTKDAVTMKFGDTVLNFGSVFFDVLGLVFAPPPIINFSREKNLIITPVSGGDAEVIERWGTKPWQMSFNILLIDSAGGQYPTQFIERMTNLFEYNDVIKVTGAQFLEKNIDSIYTKSISIDPLDGFSDTIKIALEAASIKEVKYTLKQPNK